MTFLRFVETTISPVVLIPIQKSGSRLRPISDLSFATTLCMYCRKLKNQLPVSVMAEIRILIIDIFLKIIMDSKIEFNSEIANFRVNLR